MKYIGSQAYIMRLHPLHNLMRIAHRLIIKSIVLVHLLFLGFGAVAQEKADDGDHHCLFEEKSVTVGIAAPFAFHMSYPGINLRAYYNFNEHFCIGPEYSYFNNGESEVIDFDFVVHYIIETKWFGIYPAAGPNFTVETEAEHEMVAKPGLLLGAGIHRNFKGMTVFLEYSRIEFGVNDQFATAGVMYSF